MNFGAWGAALASTAASVVFASAAMGQTLLAAPSPYTDISELTDISQYTATAYAPAIQGGNNSTITQTGIGNTASADSTAQTGGSYFGNITSQTQVGNNNTSTVAAVGNSNQLTTSQIGNNNNVTIQAYGNGNSYSSTQVGTGLSYTLQRVGNGQSVSVSQYGNK
jgi:minor curlin subunit